MLLIYADERSGQIPVSEPVGHAEILVLPVAAVSGGGSGDLSAEIADKLEHFRHQWSDLPGGIITCKKHIEAGPASHGTEINGLVRKGRVISQKCGAKMLDGVHFSGIHDRFPVRGSHPQVEGRDHGIAVAVLAGDIHAGLQVDVIDRKTCDFFH